MIGQKLRALREHKGLTMGDVEAESARIAQLHGDDNFAISANHLADLENDEAVPGCYSLYSLAVVYRYDIRELLSWFGFPGILKYPSPD